MSEVRKRSASRRPHHPSPCERADVFAIKALSEGQASEGQQKRALNWILNNACGIRDNTFYADSERDSVFASGKRFVGLEIVALLNMKNPPTEG